MNRQVEDELRHLSNAVLEATEQVDAIDRTDSAQQKSSGRGEWIARVSRSAKESQWANSWLKTFHKG